MKNKRLIILISIFAFLILIVVLCSTLFTVKNISVNWLTTLPKEHVLIGKDGEMCESIEKGGSIFLYDKESARVTLEEKYPYLNVVKIETKFPNKLVLHVADRQELFALKLNNDCYAILDGTNKVLAKYNGLQYEALSETSNPPILVEVSGQTITTDEIFVGKIAQISRISSVLSSTHEAIKRHSYEDVYAKGFIKKLNINLDYNSNITLSTSYNIDIKITKISEDLTFKITGGIAAYNKAREKGQSNGTLIIRQIGPDQIDSEFIQNQI